MKNTILYFISIVLFEILALYSVKKYSISYNKIYLIISIFSYSVIPIFLYLILKDNQKISTVNIIWNILSSIYGLMIGILIFNEKIDNTQIIGFILGFIALLFMFRVI